MLRISEGTRKWAEAGLERGDKGWIGCSEATARAIQLSDVRAAPFLIPIKDFGINISSVLMMLKFADAMVLRGIVQTEEVWGIIQEKVDDLQGWDNSNGMKGSFPQLWGKHIQLS